MIKKWGNVQVNRGYYFTDDYLDEARFSGLYGQINLCKKLNFSGNILEIGPGPGLFSAIMKKIGYEIITIDFDQNIQMDIIGELPKLPLNSMTFDCVCAFEVLEHLPFESLNACFLEMARISKSLIIISVPNIKRINPKYKFIIDIKYKNFMFQKEILKSGQTKLTNPQEHFWELGINGINEDMIIREACKAGLVVLQNKFIKPWFHFFVFHK
jgi:2-polyprenyl-3-methyl-5-hydroxy-6-metoxy-1,4-benzoquinol methylase